jgi:hypothetical protein
MVTDPTTASMQRRNQEREELVYWLCRMLVDPDAPESRMGAWRLVEKLGVEPERIVGPKGDE